MPSFGVYTVTGDGSIDMGSFNNLAYINTWVDVLGEAHITSTTTPRKLFNAGHWALGSFAALFPGGIPGIFAWKYLEYECESYVFANHGGGPLGCRVLFYHLGVGVRANFFLST